MSLLRLFPVLIGAGLHRVPFCYWFLRDQEMLKILLGVVNGLISTP